MPRLWAALAILFWCPTLVSSSRSLRHGLKHDHHHYHNARGAQHQRQHLGREAHKHKSHASPFDDLADGVKDAAEKAGRTLEKIDDATHPVTDSPTRPLMNGINRMRIEMCWKREDLWKHEECMKFLGLKCRSQRTGDGICRDFKRKIAQKCLESKNKKMRKKYCKNAKRAGVTVKRPTTTTTVAPEEDTGELHDDESIDVSDDGAEMDDADFEDDDDDDDDEDGESSSSSSVTVHDDEDDDEQSSRGSSSSSSSSGSSSVHVEDDDTDGRKKSGKSTSKPDRDGDGIPDDEDAFPDDPDEWEDTDGDGIGDNSDDDIDGDGVPNDKDAFPRDPKEDSDLDGDGIGDNSDDDIDGDGRPNDEDAFPRDPKEWKDSDGDGYGDNSDAYPNDPNCYKNPCDGNTINPWDLDKDEERPGGLPEQGYDEHSPTWVEHNDMDTWSADWRKEWPQLSETEKESIVRICFKQRNRQNTWCKRYHKHFRFAR